MSKKVFYWIFGCLMGAALLLRVGLQMYNPQTAGGEITFQTLLTIFAANPLFYFSLGAVAAVKLLPRIQKKPQRLTLLSLGLLLTLVLFYIAARELLGSPVQNPLLGLLRLLFRAPGWCILPGILLGAGLFEE